MKITFRILNTLWNSYQLAKTYMEAARFAPKDADLKEYEDALRVEDAWILSRLASLDHSGTKGLESFKPFECVKALDDFVMNDLSRWYIKIIRDRTWVTAEGKDKEAAITTLYMVVSELSKIIAPFAPFISEYIYRDLIGGESVFLGGWPTISVKPDEKLENQMALAKEIVEQLNAARDDAGIKLRWPVEEVVVSSKEDLEAVSEVICSMANAKRVCFSGKPKNAVEKEFSAGKVMLSKGRSPEIIEEGLIRDLMRQIQNMRKSEGLDVAEHVILKINAENDFVPVVEKFKDEIKSNTTSKEVIIAEGKPNSFKKEAKFEGKTVWFDYKR
jgi:isoleucyl-tRNA synthetase